MTSAEVTDPILTEVAETDIDTRAICAYLAGTWARETPLSIPRFFDWQFSGAPGADGRNRSLIVIDKKDRIGGFFGVTPRPFVLNDGVLRGAEVTTWVISADLRGGPYARAMLRHLLDRYDFVSAIGGVSAPAMSVYKQMGFKYVRAIPRFCRIYDLERTGAISTITDLGAKLVRRVGTTESSVPAVERLDVRSRYAAAPRAGHGFERSLAHLEWRYLRHPFFQYDVFVVNPRSDKQIFLVLRNEDHPDIRVCHVLECYGPEAGVPDALRFIDAHAVETTRDIADFFCLSSAVARHFWCHGWFSVLDDPEVAVPHLFNPVELKHPPTASVIMHSSQHLVDVCDLGRLHVTKGDGDLDKPTIAFLRRSHLIS